MCFVFNRCWYCLDVLQSQGWMGKPHLSPVHHQRDVMTSTVRLLAQGHREETWEESCRDSRNMPGSRTHLFIIYPKKWMNLEKKWRETLGINHLHNLWQQTYFKKKFARDIGTMTIMTYVVKWMFWPTVSCDIHDVYTNTNVVHRRKIRKDIASPWKYLYTSYRSSALHTNIVGALYGISISKLWDVPSNLTIQEVFEIRHNPLWCGCSCRDNT